MSHFMFATGIENSYPTILLPSGDVKRIDELEKTRHYKFWQRDLKLVKEMGIEFLRYGPPYYRTHIGPSRYEWTFSDEVFHYMTQLGITPIVDLCHFGVPDWIENFQNEAFPDYFAEYARTFAERFPHFKLYTPVNEMFITAMFSAQYGWWNERLTDERSCTKALKNIAKANLKAIQAILSVQPEAVFIQSESIEYFHPEDPYDAQCYNKAEFLNLKRFIPLDLTLGHPLNESIEQYLKENGFTLEDFEWFKQNAYKGPFILGTDYYVTNEHWVHKNGFTSAAGDLQGYYTLAKEYYDRYNKPLMHTETNMREPRSAEWLHKQWYELYHLKAEGVPMMGFTWYSLLDQVDWDSALREDQGNVNPLGLYDLQRNRRPVGEVYKKLIEEWKDILHHPWEPAQVKGKGLGEHLKDDFEEEERITQRKHRVTSPFLETPPRADELTR